MAAGDAGLRGDYDGLELQAELDGPFFRDPLLSGRDVFIASSRRQDVPRFYKAVGIARRRAVGASPPPFAPQDAGDGR